MFTSSNILTLQQEAQTSKNVQLTLDEDTIEDPFENPLNVQQTNMLQSSSTTHGPTSMIPQTGTDNSQQQTTQSSRRVNFTQSNNPLVSSQLRSDVPSIDAITTLLASTLQSAIHTKPSTNLKTNI